MLNYNSYKRYNLEVGDFEQNFSYINSEIKDSYKTNLIAIINPDTKEVKLFQDGELISKKEHTPDQKPQSFYNIFLGCYENKNFFKGLISSVAIFDKHLNNKEVAELSSNQHFGLTHNFGRYTSSENLVIYYDSKFIKNYKLVSLGKSRENAEINGCEIVAYDFQKITHKPVPFRRKSTFKLLSHEENGYVDGCWKDITTRYNQLRFHNEVTKGYRNTSTDGLSNLHFTEHSHTRVKNQTHVVVGI